jgi:hypothetical protein
MNGEHLSHHRIQVDERQLELLPNEDARASAAGSANDWRMDETTRLQGLAGVSEARRLLQSACERSAREQFVRTAAGKNRLDSLVGWANPRSGTVRRQLRVFR